MTTQDTTPPTADEAAAADEKLQDKLFEVTADTWGRLDEYHKGQIIDRSDPDPAHYDVEHAIRMGTLRPLTVSEARAQAPRTPTRRAAAETAPEKSVDLSGQKAKTEG